MPLFAEPPKVTSIADMMDLALTHRTRQQAEKILEKVSDDIEATRQLVALLHRCRARLKKAGLLAEYVAHVLVWFRMVNRAGQMDGHTYLIQLPERVVTADVRERTQAVHVNLKFSKTGAAFNDHDELRLLLAQVLRRFDLRHRPLLLVNEELHMLHIRFCESRLRVRGQVGIN